MPSSTPRPAPWTMTWRRACRPRSATPSSRRPWILVQHEERREARASLERQEVPLNDLADSSRRRATRATSAASCRPRCCFPGRSSRAVCSSSTRPVSAGSSRRIHWRPCPRSRRRTRCCSCRTPRRSTPNPRSSSSSTPCASRRTSPRCWPRPTSTPNGGRSSSIDRGHLGDAGDVPIFSVSSDLRLLAAELQDRALNDESGFPALVAHLRREVLGRAEVIHERARSTTSSRSSSSSRCRSAPS